MGLSLNLSLSLCLNALSAAVSGGLDGLPVHGLQLLLHHDPGLASKVSRLLIYLRLVLLQGLLALVSKYHSGDVFVGVFYGIEQAALR